ncbi:hypothetical protein GCM10009845_14550 [Pedococcus bigeumensis]|jgi:hypothetical protein
MSERTTIVRALNVAVLEATVIVCVWLGFCVATNAPYPSWSAIGIVVVAWLATTALRHRLYTRR